MTEGLAGMHIGDVNLHNRRLHGPDSILQSNGRMRIGTRIQDNAVRLKTRLLYLVNQLTLNVRLKIVYPHFGILRTKFCQTVVKRDLSVDGRFAFPQQIYVGSVDDLYPHIRFFLIFARKGHYFKVQR